MNSKHLIILILVISFCSCEREAEKSEQIRHMVFAASGDIQEKINEYKALLKNVSTIKARINTKASSQSYDLTGVKVVANANRALWELRFHVPGHMAPSGIHGVGAVFSNIDSGNSITLEFFNGGMSLGQFFAPKSSRAKKSSFIGVYFPDQEITHIKIIRKGRISDSRQNTAKSRTEESVVLHEIIYNRPQ